MKTYSIKPKEIDRHWYLLDATNQVLGRLATRIAQLLMGKHKPIFTRHLDTGDYVVVINASKISVTGDKLKQKNYYWHSGYPGGLKVRNLEELLQSQPQKVIEHAVKGMLPRNRLGTKMMKKLRVYAGEEHPHQAQITNKGDET
jgi:large subunit ribosomal protein L13